MPLCETTAHECAGVPRGSRAPRLLTAAIGLCLALNTALTSMDIRGSVISEDNMKICGDALLRNRRTKLGFVKCDCFMLQGLVSRLDLSGMLSDDL